MPQLGPTGAPSHIRFRRHKSMIGTTVGALYCRRCGASLPAESRYCRRCGVEILQDPPVDSPSLATPSQLREEFSGGIVVAGILMIVESALWGLVALEQILG